MINGDATGKAETVSEAKTGKIENLIMSFTIAKGSVTSNERSAPALVAIELAARFGREESFVPLALPTKLSLSTPFRQRSM